MTKSIRWLLFAGLACACFGLSSGTVPDRPASPRDAVAAPIADAGKNGVPAQTQKQVHQGIAVEFAVVPLRDESRKPGELFAGEDVIFRFTLTDTTTSTGLTNVRPAGWVMPKVVGEATDASSLSRKVATLVNGKRLIRPELDLNTFYVLALNDDATITVIDPLAGFGGSKLLALIALPSPGMDWVANADSSRVYVSMPASNQIAVVDTGTWNVIKNIDCASRPGRLTLQPDGHYLWIAADGMVAALDTETMQIKKTLATGAGPHDLAVTADSRFVCVSNASAGTVSVIDVRTLTKVADVPTGANPTSLAYSRAADLVYVVHEKDGTIVALSPDKRVCVAHIKTEPGSAVVRFSPTKRLGFVLNPMKNRVHVFDPATNRIVQSSDTDAGPDQLAFSDRLVYIRQSKSPIVRMLPLDALGIEGKEVQAANFPGGQKALGVGAQGCLANAISQASGEGAVLVANPGDKAIYYYKEGMAAPMGSFNNYGHSPRAVMAIDRSLRMRGPGVYETVARLRRPGEFQVLFLLDSPRLVRAFDLSVAADRERKQTAADAIAIDAIVDVNPLPVGVKTRLSIKLADQKSKTPRADLKDVEVLTFSPGGWQKRHTAQQQAPGVYAIDFVPPHEGIYYVYVQCPSLGLALNNSWSVTLQAKEVK